MLSCGLGLKLTQKSSNVSATLIDLDTVLISE